MTCRCSLVLFVAALFVVSDQCSGVDFDASVPPPGSVYREYILDNGGDADWRVTDPQATAEGAKKKLPNSILKFEVDELSHAVAATAVFDRWGGHLKTTSKRVRFNGGDWITIPEISTTPPEIAPEKFYSQDNPVIEVPIDQLKEGTNTLEGTCGVIENANWGQWGLYSMRLRIYLDPAEVSHPEVKIDSPVSGDVFGENPVVRLSADSENGISRVDVVACYHGFDENGDGEFLDWHEAYFQPTRGERAHLSEHVGTLTREPYELRWETEWIPDQNPGAIRLLTRAQDSRGVWTVSEVVDELTLERTEQTVRLFPAVDVPPRFGVRVGREESCRIPVDLKLTADAEARLALRTWHGWDGHHEPLSLNGHSFPIHGKNHHYDYDQLPISADWIRTGDNVFSIRSMTEHHMLEVLWPGPAILIRQPVDED
ncbi:hypothetical protein KOR42_27570 [Thalassoglobus neptunius]|uniref:Uncharacterized protein n=1 Tax=Thalassoglobus neptunius TaxID=1938619 RepID=A0A5C5WYG7_9PLAN|nr:hypothetical protein [Thalassoglobus neptunius]TWT55630.1 hypothetical protein KOR42_27570 [Thalassoglobus neptunius]